MAETRFTDFNNSLIANYYPRETEDLSDGYNITIAEHIEGFGIQLGAGRLAAAGSWIDVRFRDNFSGDNQVDAEIEATIVSPHNIKAVGGVGRTAVLDTLYFDVGDSFVIGRRKYPHLGTFVSGDHVRLTVSESSFGLQRINIDVQDLRTTNGTQIRTKEIIGDDTLDPSTPFDEHVTSEPAINNWAAVNEFMDKYSKDFPMLSLADFQFCLSLCNDVRVRFANDPKKMKRQLNMWVHPDRNRQVSDHIAHSMYLLAIKELEL